MTATVGKTPVKTGSQSSGVEHRQVRTDGQTDGEEEDMPDTPGKA